MSVVFLVMGLKQKAANSEILNLELTLDPMNLNPTVQQRDSPKTKNPSASARSQSSSPKLEAQ